ncbi:acyltransferase [Polaribacter sp. WD7]|uniref:1-acyl-sn-glycerol-3-phosphate acyltransferase n=1 Tax=Polaribacter sp. WD7 TaxID=2269061 RepID=UPI000DF3F88B|nr:1-acyl-sn-glycerol-3-phosphate acyltransferase [Polaribacter sp. WD7]RCS26925.1 acyltransferase [Polaribacter sp. WD7]
MKRISKFILHTILGWKIENNFPKHLKKYVVIAAPHTSWMDFPIAILVRLSLETMIHFIGKASLFKSPFGFIFRKLGGTPVDRSQSNNVVEVIIKLFETREEFRLALSPEGTRKKVAQWKTGFYYIAKGANVPILMVSLDFENKKVSISEPYYITSNKENDFRVFQDFFKGIKGKNPELF